MPLKVDFEDTSIAYNSLDKSQLLKHYYVFKLMNNNSLVNIGTYCLGLALKIGLPIKKIIKNTIFDIFCGGQDIVDCKNKIDFLFKYNVGTILDYSVEGIHDINSFDKTKKEIIEVINFASKSSNKIPFTVFKLSGLGSTDVMTNPESNKEEAINIERRFDEIIETAVNANVKVLIDAEETWIQDFIDKLALKAMIKYNKIGKTLIFNTYQFYRKDAFEILKAHHNSAQNSKASIGVKIVRGAYMEKERNRANELSYIDPINPDKNSTDILFNKGLEYCIENINGFELCIGTHNIESTKQALLLINKKGLQSNDSRIYFAQLLGMCDVISFNLASNGYNVAKYVPYGPIADVMPYLIRRAKENTAMSGQTSREYKLIKSEINRRKLNEKSW